MTDKRQTSDKQATTTKEYKNIRKKEIDSMDAIASRKRIFLDEVNSFNSYTQTMLNAFADYWTEPNKSKTKMRYELQKTWSTNLRLKTWASREKVNGIQINGNVKKSKTPIIYE
jgi:hypothetical protein